MVVKAELLVSWTVGTVGLVVEGEGLMGLVGLEHRVRAMREAMVSKWSEGLVVAEEVLVRLARMRRLR